MKRALLLVLVLLILVLALGSCGGGSSDALTKVSSSPQTYVLYAGQNTAVGEIQVWDDATNLYVNYHMYSSEWALTETHLDVVVGDTGDGIPQKNGNPIPGKFDYKTSHNYVLDYMYTIPLADIGASTGDDVSIAAHASAQQASQLLLNEGFEEPVLPSPLGLYDSSYWDVFANADIPAWDVTDETGPDAGTDGNLEYWRDNYPGIGRPDGQQIVELDSNGHLYGNDVRITQDLTGLSDNCFLSFYWRPRDNNMINGVYDCQMVVNFNGTELGTYNPSNFSGNSVGGNWDHEIIPLDTTGIDSAPLFFEETGYQSGTGGYGTLLDAVNVLSYGNGETAWSAGVPFSGSNWATFSVYTIGTGTE